MNGHRSEVTASAAVAIHLGTSSWQFDAWRGVFYPERLPRSEYLAHYVGQFDTVEVNTSFYALPAPSTVIRWVETAPPGFSFCLKAPRAISHEKRLVGCEEETRRFLDLLRSLGQAAAPAFLQLPPDFTRQGAGRPLAGYLDRLAELAGDLRLAVEVRAADLMTSTFAAFLAERGLALVLVDRAGTPDLYPLWHERVVAGGAPAFTIVRWIGDDKHGPTGDRELTARRDPELTLWAGRLQHLSASGVEVYGYMHNPYEGHAPASVRRLQALLPDAAVSPVPPQHRHMPSPSGQLPLFG